ncbi:MAG: S41 family peptidase [Candidatus Eisenbacteria bacterium]
MLVRTCPWPDRAVALLLPLLFASPAKSEGLSLDADVIRMARKPAVSPDGREIAFSYQGDLWLVASEGGDARRLTANDAYESNACWSPDGKWIAFSSNRDGSDDVYAIPVQGGTVRRLTSHIEADQPVDWTADSRAVLFESRRQLLDGREPGLWMVSLDGGTPIEILTTGCDQARLGPDGRRLAYVRGDGTWWRRGYAGNGRNRLWVYDGPSELTSTLWNGAGPATDTDSTSATAPGLDAGAAAWLGGVHRPLAEPADERGNREEPKWLPDGKHILYLNDTKGTANVKLLDLESGERRALTDYHGERLRFPSLSRDGRVLALEVEDEIHVLRLPANVAAGTGLPLQPTPLRAQLPLDARSADLERLAIQGGATEMALSPDGKQIAFVAQGEIFAMRANEEATFANRLTASASRDWQIAWAADSKSLYFVSDRDGNAEIYRVRSADTKEERLARTLVFETTRITNDPLEDVDPRISPDGQWIAFQHGRCALALMKPDGSGLHTLVDGWSELDFRWSPDSKWIAYTRDDDEYNSDLWVVPADGSRAPLNVSMHPDNDSGPVWSPDGKMLLWTSPRRFFNEADLWYVRLQQSDEEVSRRDRLDSLYKDKTGASSASEELDDSAKAAKSEGKKGSKGRGKKEGSDSTKVEVKIDARDLYRRAHRLTSFSGEESNALVSKDGKEVVFVATEDGKRDLWKISWDGTEPTRLTKDGSNPTSLQWDHDYKRIFFLKQGGVITSIPLAGGETKTYPYDAKIEVDRAAQRRFVFAEAWRALRDQYYDPNFHGADWTGLLPKYTRWAEEASTHRDFQDVLRLMLGELNSSHLETWDGPNDTPPVPIGVETGELGVVLRPGGDELVIARVVPRSPADRVESKLEAGEALLSVGGTKVTRAVDLAQLLDHTVDQPTLLEVRGRNGAVRRVEIRPTSRDALRAALYLEQIDHRRGYVTRAGSGRVGYLHIQGMGAGNMDDYERDLYAVAHGKDALIIDVRENGGGWITDFLLASLLAPEHAVTRARGSQPAYPQDRRLVYAWSKPIVVLCDENSFSNAEIFAQAIKTLKRGPIVGQETYGGIISTGGTTLGDGSFVRLPFRGWTTLEDNTDLENRGCRPDVSIDNNPNDLSAGRDRQLERAVKEALRQIE